MSKNITTMIGFGFWDGSNNGFAGVNDNVLNVLDFPMESLEGDDLAEDLNSKFRRLGPIPWEALQRLSSTPTLDFQNGSSDMQSDSSVLLNQEPELVEETPIINNPRNSSIRKEPPVPLEPPRSPISALSSSSSCSGKKTVPVSLKSPINNSKTRKGWRKKRKISQLFSVRQKPFKKCTHCESIRTPQWRDGPMGPKSLCNACGVRYRTGRLLPEYRPAGSPTFVPSLHSNLHKKVVEMRNGAKEGEGE